MVPPRNPLPFTVKFVAFSVKAMALPTGPGTVAETITVAPDRTAVATLGISVLIAVTILLPCVVVLVFSVTSNGFTRRILKVNV